MRSLVNIDYREVVNGVETVSYNSPEIDDSINRGLYTALGSLATVGTSSFMRMVEFDPGFKVIGLHVGVTEALAAVSVAGVVYGADKIGSSIDAIRQQIENSRLKNPSKSPTRSISKALGVQLGNH